MENLLKEIKKALPHGALTDIANKVGIDRINVARILRGEWKNDEVVKEAISIIKNDVETKQDLLLRVTILQTEKVRQNEGLVS